MSGKLRDERLHGDATHRVADQHRTVQVETLQHGAHVLREVLHGMPGAPDHRSSVAAVIERDRAKSRPRQRFELVEPLAYRVGDAVRQDDRRAVARLDEIERTAVEGVESPIDVDGRIQRACGVAVGATLEPPHEHALPRVTRPGHRSRRAERDAGNPGTTPPPAHGRYNRGTRGPIPQTMVYAIVPIARAHDAAVTSSSPWRPISTTSSPTSTGRSPTSSIS